MIKRSPCVKAVEEVWENQMYLPVRGWGGSFTFDTYTDKTCTKTLSEDQFPNIPLIEGWQWTTEWTIDTSHGFGNVDAEGWCYASSLDKLVASIMSKTSSADNLPSCMVRRRRWIRERSCVSEDAMQLHQERIEYLMISRSRMETALSKKKMDYDSVISYEEARAKEFGDITLKYFSGMAASVEEFRKYNSRLLAIQEMLVAQAAIDREYARKLEELASAFSPDRNSPHLFARDRVDSGEDGNFLGEGSSASERHLSDEQEVLIGADGLLSCISESNATASLLWRDFSSMIGESMIQDIEDTLAGVASVLKAMDDLVLLREKMKPIQARVATALADLKTSYALSSRKLQTLMTEMERDISGGTRLSTSADGTGDAAEEESSQTMAIVSSGCDMWLSIRAYKSSVIELSHNLQLLHIRESKLCEQKRNITQRLRLLFVATMQLFVHERSRIFMDSAEYLERRKQVELMKQKRGQSAKAKVSEESVNESEVENTYVPVKSVPAPNDSSALALPNGSGQILMQSIMQITTLENARSYGKDKTERRGSFLGGMLGASSESGPTDLMSAKVVATTDGILHIFLMEGSHASSSQVSDKPYKSLVLEDCNIIQQAESARSGVMDHSVEIHQRSSSSAGILSLKRDDAIVLVPLSEEEASAWLAVFCDPICGASLLMPLISGAKVPERRASVTSLDAFSTGVSKLEEMFVTVPPETLKSRRKSVTTAGAFSNPQSSSSATSNVMAQSNAALELAREMMNEAAVSGLDISDMEGGDENDDESRLTLDLSDDNTATL